MRKGFFKSNKNPKYTFLEKLDPQLPVIQCSDFKWPDCCAGGPLFDTNRKVVGMALIETTCQVAIHVSFLMLSLERYIKAKKSGK